jgi:hypothetical protein
LIGHGPQREQRLKKFFIAAGTSLPSNDRGIHSHTRRLMGGIYEVRRLDGLRCHDIHTKYKDCFRHPKVNRKGEIYRHTDSTVISLSLLAFFKIREAIY